MRAFFRRRLGDENDKLVFILVFIVGIATIFSLRRLGDLTSTGYGISFFDIGAALAAVGFIVVYITFILCTKNRSSISVDRASDNVYYLGLLFTLSSLTYSLIKLSLNFSDEQVLEAGYVLSLLPDFGIALFSTIAGIAGRILLQQMQNDPKDVESRARDELGDASRDLKYRIGQILLDLEGLSGEIKRILAKLNNTVAKNVEELNDGLKTQIETIKNQFKELEDIPSSLEKRFTSLSASIEEMIGKIDESTMKQNQLTEKLIDSISSLNQIFSDKNLKHTFSMISEMGERIKKTAADLGNREDRLKDSVSELEIKIEDIKSNTQSVKNYGNKIEASVKSVDEANTEYLEELSKAAETLRKETDYS